MQRLDSETSRRPRRPVPRHARKAVEKQRGAPVSTAPISLVLVTMALFTLMVAVGPTWALQSRPAAESVPEAAEVLGSILERVVAEAEEIELERLRVRAAESSVLASIRPDPLALEFQTEGINDSLSREAHALDVARLVTPLALPGQRRARRATEQVAGAWSSAALKDARWRVAAQAAREWSMWAAVAAETQFREQRLSRSTRAVRIFEARFEAGEVSGSEVRQLEAQVAEDRAALLELEAERRMTALRLRQLLGFEAQPPSSAALAQLTDWLRSPVVGEGSAPIVEASRAWAELETAQARVLEKTASGPPEVGFQLERVPSVLGVPSVEAFGVHLRLPLSLGRRSSDRKDAARARAESARYETAQTLRRHQERIDVLRELEQMVSSSLLDLAPLAERLEQARDSLLEQFRLDAISYLAFLDGADRLDQVRLRQLELQRQLVQTRIELAVAVGDDSQLPLGGPANQTETETAR